MSKGRRHRCHFCKVLYSCIGEPECCDHMCPPCLIASYEKYDHPKMAEAVRKKLDTLA